MSVSHHTPNPASIPLHLSCKKLAYQLVIQVIDSQILSYYDNFSCSNGCHRTSSLSRKDGMKNACIYSSTAWHARSALANSVLVNFASIFFSYLIHTCKWKMEICICSYLPSVPDFADSTGISIFVPVTVPDFEL